MLDKAKTYFLDKPDLEGIKESRDSYDKKLIFLVPMALVGKISGIVRDIEENCPECQVDVELNSLEDAYVKIAEDEIAAKDAELAEHKSSEINYDEQEDFLKFVDNVGTQSFWKKVITVTMIRIRSFKRQSYQVIAIFVPLINVSTGMVMTYAFIKASTQGTDNSNTVIRVAFSVYFPFLLIIGFCFSAGVYLITAM